MHIQTSNRLVDSASRKFRQFAQRIQSGATADLYAARPSLLYGTEQMLHLNKRTMPGTECICGANKSYIISFEHTQYNMDTHAPKRTDIRVYINIDFWTFVFALLRFFGSSDFKFKIMPCLPVWALPVNKYRLPMFNTFKNGAHMLCLSARPSPYHAYTMLPCKVNGPRFGIAFMGTGSFGVA